MEENKNNISAIKIGLLGTTTVGKTAIVNSIMGLEFNEDMLMTIGSYKLEKEFKLKNDKNIKLVFWDVCGAERQRPIAMNYMKSAQGIILIFDFTQKKSFDDLNSWLVLIKDDLLDPLIVIFGNKIDIEKDKWEVTSEEANKFAKEKGIAFFETSAKTGKGINEGLSYFVNAVYNKIKSIDDKKITIDNTKTNNNFNCAGNKKGKNNKK